MSEEAEAPAPARPRGKKKLLLLAVPVVLAGVGAAGWFSGLIPGLLRGGAKPAVAAANAPPVYVDIPEIITNLNVPGRRPSYLKLHVKLESPAGQDPAPLAAAQPRLLDLFQTYLRDMRPEELRGSEGSYRLREALLARANAAVSPARLSDVLFVEMVIE